MDDREQAAFDNIAARMGEQFADYVILARAHNGAVTWRASDPTWAEGAADQYVRYARMGTHLQQMDEFNRGR